LIASGSVAARRQRGCDGGHNFVDWPEAVAVLPLGEVPTSALNPPGAKRLRLTPPGCRTSAGSRAGAHCAAADKLRLPGYAQELAGKFLSAELHVLDACGHCRKIERADDVNRILLDFLGPARQAGLYPYHRL
jgi:pimeloyl-ACP methyl ester carboxylesterase